MIHMELGNIYYRYDEEKEDNEVLRIVKILNEKEVSVSNEDTHTIKRMELKELQKDYEKLVSHAILTITEVAIGSNANGTLIRDVVIMVFRNEVNMDEINSDTTPDIVCRQGITDIFYEPFCNEGENPMAGISVSKETIPSGYDMDMIRHCDEVLDYKIVNLYRKDTIDTILYLIEKGSSDKWDTIILNMMKAKYDSDRQKNPFLPADLPKDPYYGYCHTLRELLVTNNFMYDFYYLLGITKVTFEIPFNPELKENPLPDDQRIALQEIYEMNMCKTLVVPFDYDIDLERVKVPYVLAMDATDTLYFIAFTRSETEYVKKIDTTMMEQVATINNQLSEAVEFYNKYSRG